MTPYKRLKIYSLLLVSLGTASCQLGYIAESAFYQAKLLRKRVPLQYALDHYKLTDDERDRLKLAIELRNFMKTELQLETKDNYSRYVHLDQKYVTYAVNAAKKDQLKAYTWSFPIIGKVPYKGYFKEESALEEEEKLKSKGLDTHVRGVSAYSTLGWFEDPLLSSMLRMKEHHFVNTLIHETVHANLYISSESKFNERVASFLGQLGAEAYYGREKRADELNKIMTSENHDELLFSKFISVELQKLRQWYKDKNGDTDTVSLREKKFEEMKQNFSKAVLGKLKTENYKWFARKKLNNAFLLLLELYNSDFSILEKLANHHNRDFKQVFNELKKLEDAPNPEQALKDRVNAIK